MNIVLIGATGLVGRATLNELTRRGHRVTAISRHSGDLESQTGVVAEPLDVLNTGALASVVAGHDAVVSAFNPGWTNPNLYEEFLHGSASIQQGVKQAGVRRLLVVGGAGSLYVADDLQAVDTEGFPDEWKAGALAARDYLTELQREQELDWTFLSPALEMHQGTSGERLGAYREGLDTPVYDEAGRSVISVEDLAVAIVDELENPKHSRQRFTVAY
ncbi:hypothetical protein CLV84_3042 [Neolewinella xylanilytica]|uniref:NAD(P)-binding domain-containing protein n=1 Tax=Neolewinella xylanilytica TaxID=1514080 RepID=A0A2S6I4L0_9BACT|nr:NAD(P)H-binding protein [Neolewinella xylanilytica]PPK86123.1 hypothetical protein CLV84_3042 [Neolewinella xylanilytica]